MGLCKQLHKTLVFIIPAKYYFNPVFPVNHNTLNQRYDNSAVKGGYALMFAKLIYPATVVCAVHLLRHLTLKCVNLFFCLVSAAGVRLFQILIFLLVKDAVSQAFVKGLQELLAALDFFLLLCDTLL